MVDVKKAKSKAQKLVEGFTLVSARETDKVWFFEFKYYPGKTGADGAVVIVDKRTGEANQIDLYSEEGYALLVESSPVGDAEWT